MSARGIEAVAIGASAGGVQALLQLLPALPADYPWPVLVVVHVPPDRDNALVPLLQAKCAVRVKEAEDKEPTEGGVIYFAPSDYHLLVEADGALALSSDEPLNFSRPAIDVLLESAADAFGQRLAGIVLTGANSDGALGLQRVFECGGEALVQDPAEAHSPAMPAAALRACPAARSLPLSGITTYLLALGGA